MRLPLFQLIEDSVALLERRRDYYRTCAYELQEMLQRTLRCDALLGVNRRVKASASLREKIVRKRLYLKYQDAYEMLSNLSDLVGLRAECRFLSEEKKLYDRLCSACSQRHQDGTRSMPEEPNMHFHLDCRQPEQQKNGLSIYRIDGYYSKNGVSTPFEVQIKAMVHVFWTEVEHRLIYKNNSYQLVDDFMKNLLYSTYTNLEQVDHHLQLIYDQMQRPATPERLMHNEGIETLLAKAISDLFFRRMEQQMGFSLKLHDACDTIAHYMFSRAGGVSFNESFQILYQRITTAAMATLQFEEMIDLKGTLEQEDVFVANLGGHLLELINVDYDWNLFFRMLFAMESGDQMESFTEFLRSYRARFAEEILYLPLYAAWGQTHAEAYREQVLQKLSLQLVAHSDISMLSREIVLAVEAAISEACTLLSAGLADPDVIDGLLEQALQKNA